VYFCALQSKQVAINHTSGARGGMVKPCCSFTDSFELPWQHMNIKNFNNFNEMLLTPDWDKLRKSGKIMNCNRCISDEVNTNHSLRSYWNNELMDDKVQLELLHLSVDSLCNMSCLSCSPAQSSTWNKKTNLDILHKEISDSFKSNTALTDYVKEFKRVAENTDYSHLTTLKISGGEPFYSENFYWFIDHIASKIDIGQVDIWINTNASVIPKSHTWKLLGKFKSLQLDMSLDAVGEYHNYIRYGSTWNDILNFINFVNDNKHDNTTLGVHSVYSVLNYNVFEDIIKFCEHNKLTHMHSLLNWPDYLSIFNLPAEYRQKYQIEDIRMYKTNIALRNPSMVKTPTGKLGRYIELMEKENNNSLELVNAELARCIKLYNL